MHFRHQHDVLNLHVQYHRNIYNYRASKRRPVIQAFKSSYASYMHQFQGHIRMQEKGENNFHWKLGASANQPSCIDLGNVQTLSLKRDDFPCDLGRKDNKTVLSNIAGYRILHHKPWT